MRNTTSPHLSKCLLISAAIGVCCLAQPRTTQASPITGIAKWVSANLAWDAVKSAFNRVTGRSSPADLDKRLYAVEKPLRSVDPRFAAEIAAMRKSIRGSVSREEYEKSLKSTLARIDTVERRITRLEGRVDSLERLVEALRRRVPRELSPEERQQYLNIINRKGL